MQGLHRLTLAIAAARAAVMAAQAFMQARCEPSRLHALVVSERRLILAWGHV